MFLGLELLALRIPELRQELLEHFQMVVELARDVYGYQLLAVPSGKKSMPREHKTVTHSSDQQEQHQYHYLRVISKIPTRLIQQLTAQDMKAGKVRKIA